MYAIEEVFINIEGLRVIHDKLGHASLTVTRRMKISELIGKLEMLATKMESIGRIKVSP